MGNMCEPKCQLSLCDKNTKIAESTIPLRLLVWKGNKRQCDIELTPIGGDIVLTDTEILEFGAEGQTFKIQLRDNNNVPYELMYKDCLGDDQVAETIRLSFIECDSQNDHLNEIC